MTFSMTRLRLPLVLAALLALPNLAMAFPGSSNFPLCSAGIPGAASDGNHYCLGAADTTYNITIVQVGFKRTDGQFFWFGTQQTVNVAAGATGSTISSYLNGIVLPNGTYTEIHAIVKMTQTVQSTAQFTIPGGGGVCHAGTVTADRGYDNPSELCTGAGSMNVATPYQNNITATSGCVDPGSDNNYAGGSLSPPIVITSPASSYTIHYNFDISKGITYQTNAGGTTCSIVGPGNMRPTFTVTQ